MYIVLYIEQTVIWSKTYLIIKNKKNVKSFNSLTEISSISEGNYLRLPFPPPQKFTEIQNSLLGKLFL